MIPSKPPNVCAASSPPRGSSREPRGEDGPGGSRGPQNPVSANHRAPPPRPRCSSGRGSRRPRRSRRTRAARAAQLHERELRHVVIATGPSTMVTGASRPARPAHLPRLHEVAEAPWRVACPHAAHPVGILLDRGLRLPAAEAIEEVGALAVGRRAAADQDPDGAQSLQPPDVLAPVRLAPVA